MILAHARCIPGAKPPPPQPAAFPGVNLKHAEAEVNARLKEALELATQWVNSEDWSAADFVQTMEQRLGSIRCQSRILTGQSCSRLVASSPDSSFNANVTEA